jgi:hypothetical protein
VAVLPEKPSVARDIANVLAATTRGEGYLHGSGYVVTWAIGHLASLAQPPFAEKDLQRRVLTSKRGEPETLDLMQELLKPPHLVRVSGIASHNGGRAYVVESLPPNRLRAYASRMRVFDDAILRRWK